MSPNGQVTRQQAEQQLSAREQSQSQAAKRTEEHEYEKSAKAQAGINLNLFAAVSGIFSGKKNKTTTADENGKEHSVEHSTGASKIDGAGHGTLSAVGQGEVNERSRKRIVEKQGQKQNQKAVEGVNHLGLEEGK